MITDPHEIDDAIDLWHDGGGKGLALHEFLGWTWEQYAAYVERGEIPTPEAT